MDINAHPAVTYISLHNHVVWSDSQESKVPYRIFWQTALTGLDADSLTGCVCVQADLILHWALISDGTFSYDMAPISLQDNSEQTCQY